MNERIKIVEYKGKKVLVCDFSTLMMNKFIDLLYESFDYIKNQTDLLILFDVSQASVFGDALKESKSFAKKIHPYRKNLLL